MMNSGTAEVVSVDMVCRDLGPGGAARATRRLVESLWNGAPETYEVSLLTARGPTVDPRHRSGLPGGSARVLRRASRKLSDAKDALPSRTGSQILQSRADVWTGLGAQLNRRARDVINLHWLGNETISIEEIGRLKSPIVATLHDMWLIDGTAHYSTEERYLRSHSRASRPAGASGVDWDRRTWLRKVRSWQRPLHIVTPSRWLARCASQSPLTMSWPISVIPNPIDTEFWAPLDRAAARSLLGIPLDSVLLLFGAVGGQAQSIKGGDLLIEALQSLRPRLSADLGGRFVAGVFGGSAKSEGSAKVKREPFPVRSFGKVTDDRILRALYAAADVMVVPSRMDNLPQTAVEAASCGTPVVAFDVGGLPDIISDGETGRLVPPYDTSALADAIAWILDDEARRLMLGRNARHAIVERFNSKIVIAAYLEIFDELARAKA